MVQKELVIVLQASVVDSLPVRAAQMLRENLYRDERRRLRERLDRFRPGSGEHYDTITPDANSDAANLPSSPEQNN